MGIGDILKLDNLKPKSNHSNRKISVFKVN